MKTTLVVRWFLALTVALAAIGTYDTASAAPSTAGNRPLERAYERNRERLIAVRARIDVAALRADKVAASISQAKAKGKDTTALENALRDFRSAVAAADSSWREAQTVLNTHAGFDNTGKVTDATAAKATVESANAKLTQAHTTLRDGYAALRKAIAEWRKANRGATAPQVPANE